ncbi:MAG: HDOD domain-containing protein, partial [Chromatiales bacterium]
MEKADVDALAAELSGLELPVLSSTRDDVVAIANNAKLSMSQFGRALFKDMGLALKVLRIANSIEPRRFGTELESLEKAVMMVGVDRIARLATDSATIEQAADESVQVRLKRLYARSYLTALMAESWAEARHDIS